MSEIEHLLGAVAGFGVPTTPPPPDAPLDDRCWSALLTHVRSQRLSGLLAAAISTRSWPVTDTQLVQATDAHVSQSAWVLLLEQRLVALAPALEAAGVDFRVLKGSALAHLDYGDPADRCFGDVDLVVPGDHFPAACAVLEELGGTRRYPEPRPGFDTTFSKGASFRLPGGQEIDLHRTLVLGWFGLALDPRDLFRSAELFSIGGRGLPALSLPERMVHACIHASLGTSTPRWLPVRDVVQLTLNTDDIDATLARARSWRCEIVVADAITHAWSRLGLTVDHDLVRWAHDYPTTDRSRARLAAYGGQDRSHARLALSGFSAVTGWRNRIRYLTAILAPRRAPDRAPTLVRFRHGLRAVRTWRSS